MASNYELSQAAYEKAHPILECHACGAQVESFQHVRTGVITLHGHYTPEGTWCSCRAPALFPRKRT